MKIDIHTHTKKCKSGDAPTRDVSPEVFREKVLATDVRIIAITNHNHFDLAQYREIAAELGQDAQVWPGIEIDVCEQSTRGHLLVIVSPDSADNFAATVDQLTADSIPDNFSASINEVHSAFDYLGPLYVAHYKQKKPSISDAGIAELESKTSNPRRVVKEVTNAISAGIYISHGHASIYGSDLHDWSKYEEIATQLPELRLPVESFDHFCLLLEKDSVTINSLLDQKTSEELTLTPFGDETELKIRVYNDINVIFGTKGTGKSCILRAIAKHYSDNGTDARVYESASDRLDEIFDVKGKQLTRNLEHFDISYCTDEIEALRSAREVSVTNLGNYSSFFTANITNRNGRKLRIKEIPV